MSGKEKIVLHEKAIEILGNIECHKISIQINEDNIKKIPSIEYECRKIIEILKLRIEKNELKYKEIINQLK